MNARSLDGLGNRDNNKSLFRDQAQADQFERSDFKIVKLDKATQTKGFTIDLDAKSLRNISIKVSQKEDSEEEKFGMMEEDVDDDDDRQNSSSSELTSNNLVDGKLSD